MTLNASQSPKTIAVLGAGFGGMSAAYDLAKAGHKVSIYEAASGVGGLASGFKEPHWDWSVERFYHHFSPAIRLCSSSSMSWAWGRWCSSAAL